MRMTSKSIFQSEGLIYFLAILIRLSVNFNYFRNLQGGPPPQPPPNDGGGGGNQQQKPERLIILSFSDITETPLIDDWRSQVLFFELYYEEDNSFFYHNYVIGEPMII
jgi:hypothetical protein